MFYTMDTHIHNMNAHVATHIKHTAKNLHKLRRGKYFGPTFLDELKFNILNVLMETASV